MRRTLGPLTKNGDTCGGGSDLVEQGDGSAACLEFVRVGVAMLLVEHYFEFGLG